MEEPANGHYAELRREIGFSGASTGHPDINKDISGVVRRCKKRRNQTKTNALDSLSDIADAEAKKHKKAAERKKGALPKKASKAMEKVKSPMRSSKINYDALKILDEELVKYNTQLICLWKFGHQCPTSPLLPPRKVPLEDLIYTSCTDPIPQPAAARTHRLHQPSTVTHLFYAYVRKATDTEFNVFVLGWHLILVCDSLAKQLRTSLKICE
ncbi:hypothetical protein F511_26919 [Dorcoceras hygrometricum]|uniref:Uncharacterized protein n=1 Tax=Dorcoceras hygrometricum TaxID=472368 RepID=A0A2Z7BZ47_9LAMI|nr:hypothetical protein F511_26919 [Dorcoceras hygrometricum]